MTSPRANLLLVGNDSNLRGLLIHFLALEGYKFFDADTKPATLSLAAEIMPDVIIVDESLSDCEGLAVCQAIKSGETTRSLPVVFMTGSGQTDLRKQASDFGVEEYLTKPPEAVELRARVRNLLRIQSLKDRLLQANREMEEEAKKLAPKRGRKTRVETPAEVEETKEPARVPALRFL
ncbi:MAG: response regulator, partial [bacterium]